MNPRTKIGVYGLGLTVAFSAALAVGHVVAPVGADPAPTPTHGGHTDAETPHEKVADDMAAADDAAGGLRISERGYTLRPTDASLTAGERATFRFQITGPDGEPVTRYSPSHEKDLHLIVVRRDMSGFQHVHPAREADGTWSTPLTLTPGDHRVFADFVPADDDAGALTLGTDVSVSGDYQPVPLPEPASTTSVDGYDLTLEGDLSVGTSSALTLSVSRDGEPVTDLQPHFGTYGHLVALRQGDLAYLHVHPRGEAGDGSTPAGPEIAFHTQAPSAGTYRLYLDFRHRGKVRTAEFTVATGAEAGAGADTADESGGHQH